MKSNAPLILNRDCYCRPVDRRDIIQTILDQEADPNMSEMLAHRPHYFANTSIFLSPTNLSDMHGQIQAIENIVKRPAYVQAAQQRSPRSLDIARRGQTKGVFMGYDFHITEDGPKLIEINSNAGGAFIVNMIEQSGGTSSGKFAQYIMDMFQSEWALAGRIGEFKTLAIVDADPQTQYHYPDMCLAKALFETHGVKVVITDPKHLKIKDGQVFHAGLSIDVIYNRLTDFRLRLPENEIIRRAYEDDLAVVTPAPHHHSLYADKRNLITLTDQNKLASFGTSPAELARLNSIPKTKPVTPETADELWQSRKSLFFKPASGFGSRGAFRGAKLTRKVWADILEGGYIAQDRIRPPLRAVTVDGQKASLKFDVRVYTYDGAPLLHAARIYQGQTTNLRTAGGGLASVLPIPYPCMQSLKFQTDVSDRLSA